MAWWSHKRTSRGIPQAVRCIDQYGLDVLSILLTFYFQSKPAQGRGKKGFDAEANCEEDYTFVPAQQANEKPLEDASFPDTQLLEHVVSACLFWLMILCDIWKFCCIAVNNYNDTVSISS